MKMGYTSSKIHGGERQRLDAAQEAAASALDGSVLIAAGPGSGKTRVLVERVSRLVHERGVAAEQILAITFTNKAADEIRDRIRVKVESMVLAQRTPSYSQLSTFHSPVVLTFHALAHMMLREYGPLVGVPEKFLVGQRKHPRSTSTSPDTLDFDALLEKALELLRDHEITRRVYQKRFLYILVDEYQDTSLVQNALLDVLAAEHRNLCVIGDPNQAIYSFRGADPRHFATFTERYPDTQVSRLGRNYRSTPQIAAVADSCIEGCTTSAVARVLCATSDVVHDRPKMVRVPSDRAETAWIARTIEQEIGGTDLLHAGAGGFSFGDFAVIYRLHALAHELESALAHAGIPFRTIGGRGFFERSEIRVVLEKLKRIDLADHDASTSCKPNFVAAVGKKLSTLSQILATLAAQSGIKKRKNAGREQHDDAPLSERTLDLVSISAQFDHLPLEMARRALLERAVLEEPEDERTSGEHVTLLTAHAAKGLEFPVVFVAGVEEGLFPYLRPDETHNDERIAEERRLLYVAMTRAKERLFLSHTDTRTLFGKTYVPEPSRFLTKLPNGLFANTRFPFSHKKRERPKQGALF